jgi:polysaccharide biosynthesis/export protein
MKLSSVFTIKNALVTIIFSLFATTFTFSQKIETLSDAQIVEFMKMAESKGMSESDIEKYAISRGYSMMDVSKLKDRISKLKNPKEKNLYNSKDSNQDSRVYQEKAYEIENDDKNKANVSEKKEEQQKDKVEKTEKEKVDQKVLQIYGASLFNKKNLPFEANLRLPTPKNYIIGPDDELIVDIYGNSQMNYKTKVSAEGTVKFENLAPIFVNGLSIEQASERIINRLKSIYFGLNSQNGGVYAQVTLGNIRSIKVTVIGEAGQPGTYTVPSLATIFNVLYQAGGPSANGSFRNIQLIRENKVIRVLDLYDFLQKADQTNNIIVKDQDIIKINDYENRVYMQGQVKRPAIYEIKKGENLKTALSYAGNFAERAYTKTVKVKRYTDYEQKIVEVASADFDSFMPQMGDRYLVDSVSNTFENRITLKGAVKRPGEFAYGPGGVTTLKGLLELAGGFDDGAFKQRGTIERSDDILDMQNIQFNPSKILDGTDADIDLKKEDKIIISFYKDLHENYSVELYGQVNKPDVYIYKKNMTVADLVTEAGGFKDAASTNKIQVSRRVKYDSLGVEKWQNIKIIDIKVDPTLSYKAEELKTTLAPFDIVMVKSMTNYQVHEEVVLTGEINYPGLYVLTGSQERLSQLLSRAGGVKDEGFLAGSKIFRDNNIISINFQKALNNPNGQDDIYLMSGDSIVVPRISQTIEIKGAVQNPALVTFNTGAKLKSYINKAGGELETANIKKTYVIYPNGESMRTHSYLLGLIKFFPKIQPGSTVYVPIKDLERRRNKITIAELTAITTTIVSVVSLISVISK